jgi:ERF superfamily
MNHSEQINELAAALSKAQAAIRPAAKESVNPHFKSKYADLAAIWAACREPLTANGLAVVQLPIEAAAGHVGLTTMLLHSSGQFIQSTAVVRLVKDDAQGMGSAITYLKRYGLAAMVGVVADDDDDGNAAVARPAVQQRNGSVVVRPRRGDTLTDDPDDLRAKLLDLMGTVESGGHQLTSAEIKLLDAINDLPVDRLINGITHFETVLAELPPAS